MPARVRRVLNVESGLNDGIATPFVNLFLAGAATAEAVHGASSVASAAFDLARRCEASASESGSSGSGAHDPGPQASLERTQFPASGRARTGALRVLRLGACRHQRLRGRFRGWSWPSAPRIARHRRTRRSSSQRKRAHSCRSSSGSCSAPSCWFRVSTAPPGAISCSPSSRSRSCAWCPWRCRLSAPVSTGPPWPSWAGSAPAAWPASSSASSPWTPSTGRRPRSSWRAVTVTVALSVLLHGVTASPLAARYGRVASRLHLERPEHRSAGPITTRSLRRRAGFAAIGPGVGSGRGHARLANPWPAFT